MRLLPNSEIRFFCGAGLETCTTILYLNKGTINSRVEYKFAIPPDRIACGVISCPGVVAPPKPAVALRIIILFPAGVFGGDH